jgi:hypothetical protein
MTWRQSFAAWWAVSWPGLLLVVMVQVILLLRYDPMAFRQPWSRELGWAGDAIFFVLQWVMVPRLFNRPLAGLLLPLRRKLTGDERFTIALYLALPQVLLIAGFATFLAFFEDRLAVETLRFLGTLTVYARYVVIGPWSITFALALTGIIRYDKA